MDARCPPKLALHVFHLGGGGAQASTVSLAAELAGRGHPVDLVVCRAAGPRLAHVPDAVNLVELRPSVLFGAYMLAADPLALFAAVWRYARGRPGPLLRHIRYVPGLVRYLRRERPQALLSAMTASNLLVLWARKLAGGPTRIVISEREHVQTQLREAGWQYLLPMIRRMYPRADARVAVAKGVADAVSLVARIPRADVVAIYNPVYHDGMLALAKAPVDHPWLAPDAPPVVLGVGRLAPQKDFATLLRAFARVRRQRRARLLILGEGVRRPELETLAGTLGVAADVGMPGFVENPHAYLARAAVFALSSRWEGLPRVVIEALAAGCPVVSTDCPGGPTEILEGGAWGRLVPVGDSRALAEALLATLDEAPPRDRLRRRAQCFSVERSADGYLEVLLGAPAT